MAVSEPQSNSPSVPAATSPSTAQATPVANPPHHSPSSSAQLQSSNSAQQTTSPGAQTQGQETATPSPPAPASTTREFRPRAVSQGTSGMTSATPFSSSNAAPSQRKSASKKSQMSRHRTANATRIAQPIPRRSRRTARKSKDGILRAGTRHDRRRGALSTSVRRSRRRDWAAPSEPSQHGMVTRSRGSVTWTYQQMEADAERAIRRASWRRRALRRRREEQRGYGRF